MNFKLNDKIFGEISEYMFNSLKKEHLKEDIALFE